MPLGLKYLTFGSQRTFRQILGLGMSYEYIFITLKDFAKQSESTQRERRMKGEMLEWKMRLVLV
jgi:hypothetical protein